MKKIMLSVLISLICLLISCSQPDNKPETNSVAEEISSSIQIIASSLENASRFLKPVANTIEITLTDMDMDSVYGVAFEPFNGNWNNNITSYNRDKFISASYGTYLVQKNAMISGCMKFTLSDFGLPGGSSFYLFKAEDLNIGEDMTKEIISASTGYSYYIGSYTVDTEELSQAGINLENVVSFIDSTYRGYGRTVLDIQGNYSGIITRDGIHDLSEGGKFSYVIFGLKEPSDKLWGTYSLVLTNPVEITSDESIDITTGSAAYIIKASEVPQMLEIEYNDTYYIYPGRLYSLDGNNTGDLIDLSYSNGRYRYYIDSLDEDMYFVPSIYNRDTRERYHGTEKVSEILLHKADETEISAIELPVSDSMFNDSIYKASMNMSEYSNSAIPIIFNSEGFLAIDLAINIKAPAISKGTLSIRFDIGNGDGYYYEDIDIVNGEGSVICRYQNVSPKSGTIYISEIDTSSADKTLTLTMNNNPYNEDIQTYSIDNLIRGDGVSNVDSDTILKITGLNSDSHYGFYIPGANYFSNSNYEWNRNIEYTYTGNIFLFDPKNNATTIMFSLSELGIREPVSELKFFETNSKAADDYMFDYSTDEASFSDSGFDIYISTFDVNLNLMNINPSGVVFNESIELLSTEQDTKDFNWKYRTGNLNLDANWSSSAINNFAADPEFTMYMVVCLKNPSENLEMKGLYNVCEPKELAAGIENTIQSSQSYIIEKSDETRIVEAEVPVYSSKISQFYTAGSGMNHKSNMILKEEYRDDNKYSVTVYLAPSSDDLILNPVFFDYSNNTLEESKESGNILIRPITDDDKSLFHEISISDKLFDSNGEYTISFTEDDIKSFITAYGDLYIPVIINDTGLNTKHLELIMETSGFEDNVLWVNLIYQERNGGWGSRDGETGPDNQVAILEIDRNRDIVPYFLNIRSWNDNTSTESIQRSITFTFKK